NDGMLGSDTHLGTFGPADQGRGAWQDPWGISHELSFLEPFCNEIPYGGEVVNPPKAMKAAEYVEALSKLRVSYLNCTHDAALLDAWKKELYEGRSLYDHIGERLGYRFLVRQVRVKEDRGSLGVSLEVVNEGFGCLCEDARVQILTGRSGEEVPDAALGYLDGSLKALSGKGSRLLKGSFSLEGRKEMGAAGPKRIYARILRSRDERVIRFAQEGREGFLLLGEQG
ncbi:MAG: DUF4832 domain-containing protein, partial [Lachnospiraceae bacterium]|nr:DUF4832 domain-containing protein [Lachnospiraceae bacterium]